MNNSRDGGPHLYVLRLLFMGSSRRVFCIGITSACEMKSVTFCGTSFYGKSFINPFPLEYRRIGGGFEGFERTPFGGQLWRTKYSTVHHWNEVEVDKLANIQGYWTWNPRPLFYECIWAVLKWISKNRHYQLLFPISTGANSAINQSEFLVITCNFLKTRDKYSI